MKKHFLILPVMCLLSSVMFATTITSINCGNWTSPTTWDLNRTPIVSDTIVVNTFVYFNTDFTSFAPGMLNVTLCGTLCGLHHYTGCFLLSGITYVSALTAYYGHSISDADINVLQTVIVNGTGSYEVISGATCVGCTSLCQNCEAANKNKTDCLQTEILNKTNKNVLYIFPNPASDNINLIIPQKTTLEILNIEGQIIKTINNADMKITIDLSGFSSGVYILKAKTNKGIMITKFIKQ